MTIGERIKHRREQLGMTQEELAHALGYKSKSSVNKIELGKQELTQRKIKLVADALNTTVSYIMGWEDAKAGMEAVGVSLQDLAYELGVPITVFDRMDGMPESALSTFTRAASIMTDIAMREKLGISDKEWDIIQLYRQASDKDKAIVDTALGYTDM